MGWDTFLDWCLKLWVVVFIPIVGWLEKKRREFASLSQKVGNLEKEVKHINIKIDEDREERARKTYEEREHREKASDKMDKIYETLMEVRKDTAVNSTILDERK